MSFNQLILETMGSKPSNEIRNVCLIAHVDHGKTTFADSLVSSNAIISNRMAGKMRYMDSRDDEQERGITMKASGVSLLYGPLLVNLMDSPGHVDFSSEVTSALLLSDVALLLVDAIEGVCSQTQALLRQAVTNGQTVILVINKLDRLRVELRMSANEAYLHLVRLLEAMNSCVSQVVSGLSLEDESWVDLEKLEEKVHFDPAKGNVIFASAIHSYAFSVDDFAEIWGPKMKIDKAELAPCVFGDFYFQAGEIKPDAYAKGRKCLFEQLVLEPLWSLHDCALVDNDLEKLVELSGKLGVTVKTRRMPDAFDEAMRTWLPLPRACFRACVRAPSAKTAFSEPKRLQHVIGDSVTHPLIDALKECSSEGITVAFVAKFMRTEGRKMAICRVFSGKLKKGDELCILGRKIRKEGAEVLKTTIDAVYMLRGREVVPLKEATAGVICAIEAHGLVQDSTLCSDETVTEGLNIGNAMGEPLVRVSVTCSNLDQIDELKEALKLLSLLDPSLRVLELENGELAMVTAGEVHLQKCIKDLQDLGFHDIEASEPIVPFLETIIPDPSLSSTQIQQQETECRLRGEALHIKLRVAPLSEEVTSLLEKWSETLVNLRRGNEDEKELNHFKEKLFATAVATLPALKGSWWYRQTEEQIVKLFERIWSFGPDRAKGNILINNIEDYERKRIWNRSETFVRPLDQSVTTGFELFCSQGPLCHEAMRGVAVLVEEWKVDEEDAAVTGQLMAAMKQTCKVAAEKHPLRLVAAMYKCQVTTASQALGKVHGVLSQRRAKVLNEDINEATGLFEVKCVMAVIESFSFCDQLRTKTSGLASGQLEFSHWQMIDEDPYWVPTTLEEIEEFGVKGDSPNHARGYMDSVRRRKGLPTEDLIVVSAEKQRNLKRNK